MKIPEVILRENQGLSNWCILSAYRGSIAHGMYVPNSDPNSIDDKDILAVCVPPIDYYLGLKRYGSRGTQEIKQGEWDIVIYEAQKMVLLLQQGNPNVLSALWLDKEHYINISNAGQLLLDNRNLFVGKHVHKSFIGYAYGQLKRMTSFTFNGYMGEKRKRLVEQFGYDTKNAAHLIRLLRMGIEFLEEGTLHVNRLDHDADQLLDIKRGLWSLEQVKSEADKLFISVERAYAQSKLPEAPDAASVNDLCVKLVQTHLNK